ncbi:MAG: MGH1-like glycoside hydrolase domain-containing protein [Acidobacteriaceae bacterium]
MRVGVGSRGSAAFLCKVGLAAALGCSLPIDGQAHASAAAAVPLPPESAEYKAVQQHLARGWNTWDTRSVTTQVLLPEGLAIHLGMEHNSTESGDAFLPEVLIGRLDPGAEQVRPGAHAWDGSYTDLQVTWKADQWRVQSAHDGADLVVLVSPVAIPSGGVAPTAFFSVDLLWNRPGMVGRHGDAIEARTPTATTDVFCTCETPAPDTLPQPGVGGPYFAADLTGPVAISTGHKRSLEEVKAILQRQDAAYQASLSRNAKISPIVDAIETTLGWDTIFEPEQGRVVSPVSRIWSVQWGGYVIFDWDTFFAATMASVGDRDLAYADAMETLRTSTVEGFVPNYARGGNWKSFDRSEPPVGSITVLGLYEKYHDRWLLQDAYPALLKWNQWWPRHRQIDGYLAWGSDGQNPPGNLEDGARGTRAGAILESGLDNSPMYDDTVFDPKRHVLEFADVGLMSLYIADCDALATIADALNKSADAAALRARSAAFRAKLQTLWVPTEGIYLNKDLHTGKFSQRLSPTNFYPMLAHAPSAAQADQMVRQHMMNPAEFWGQWVLPSIARDDPAFRDQNYWRGRIWGPMNYLVYLGLCNYNLPAAQAALASKSYALFLREWQQHRHVHENYNAMLGEGDDVKNSDRFYHWGALLGYVEYVQTGRQGQ